MQNDNSRLIWVLGLLLVGVSVVTSPYWRQLFGYVRSGNIPGSTGGVGLGQFPTVGTGDNTGGIWQTAGLVLVVALFAGVASVSDSAGALALALLIGLWVVWLLRHTDQVAGFFKQFNR